jgi:hypothetical protein
MKNKAKPELICEILKIGKTTYYKYKRENVKILMISPTNRE